MEIKISDFTMTIQEQIPLASYTTFKIGGPARFFCQVSDEDGLREAVTFAHDKKLRVFILGGGSNILMNDKGFDGLVIKMEIIGFTIQDSGITNKGVGSTINDSGITNNKEAKITHGENVTVSVGAGEQWDTLVEQTVERGLYGLENLSAIPGTVGAAPVQNIGAYGSEAAKVITNVRAFDTKTMKFVEFSNADCHFSYRDSLFKKEKGHYIITRVDFSLSKNGKVNIGYKDLADYFANLTRVDPSKKFPNLHEVREAVINVRWGKLPDWKLWGTAGSFFKNPIISADKFAELKSKYPELPGFPESDGRVKISLGWFLDKVCDVKGLQKGNVQVYEKQALVLVTKPGATSEEVVSLAHELMNLVKEKTGIEIEGEVEWVN